MKTLYKDETFEISLSYDENIKQHIAHLNVYKWSLSIYKKLLHIIAIELNKLKEQNIFKVWSFVKDEKRKKFNMLLGFKETGLEAVCIEGTYQIMELKC